MSDEKIQIQIVDNVAPTIEPKIEGIAKSARSAYTDIERLKAALAAIDGSGLNRLTAVLSRSQRAMNDAAISAQKLSTEQYKTQASSLVAASAQEKLLTSATQTAAAQQKLRTEQQKTAAATLQAATAQQRLQTVATQTAAAQEQLRAAVQRTNAAQAQTATATANAEAAQSRAAQAALRLAAAQAKAAQAGDLMQREAEELKRSLFPLYDAQQRYNETVLRTNMLMARGAIDARTYDAALMRATANLNKVRASVNGNVSSANAFAAAQGKVTNALDKSNGAFSNYLKNTVRIAAAGLGAAAITRSADAYTSLSNKLKLVANSEADVANLTEKVFDIATRTYTPVSETAQAFTRFDRALKGLGATQAESLRLTETVNKMLVVSGANAGEAGAGLLQLSQAFNKGKLDGDEFRTVMELMPPVADAIARQMKVTRGELLRLAPQGKITADIMRNAFAEAAAEIDAQFAKTVPTIGAALTNLGTEIIKALGEFNKATGIFDGISNAIMFLSKHLKEIVVLLAAVGAGYLAAFGAPILASIVAFTTGVSAAGKAVRLFTLALIANPIILLTTALVGLITYLVLFKDSSDTARAAVDNIGKGLDALAGTITGIGKFLINFHKQTITNVIDMFKKAYNAVVSWIEDSVNFVINKINYLRDKVGKEPIELLDLTKAKESGQEFKTIGNLWRDSLDEGFNLQGDFFKNLLGAAEEELTEFHPTARFIIPPTKLDPNLEKRSVSLAKINLQLDNEIKRMNELAPLREQNAKFDAIEEQLLGKKITLNDREEASIRAKIATIESGKVVQAEMDRIYEESIGTLRTYNAVQDATADLLKRNAISAEDARRAIFLARQAYEDSIDPLREFNKEMDEQLILLRLLPREREIEQKFMQEANTLLAKGIDIRNATTDSERALAQSIRERLEVEQKAIIASQAEAALWESTQGVREKYIADLNAIAKAKALGETPGGLAKKGSITGGEAAQQVMEANPEFDFELTQTGIDARTQQYQDMYAKIEEMRAKDLISEQTAAALRAQVWSKSQQEIFAGASNFLGQLSQLQNSENAKQAKIGKAAAIAKAIIDTYTAANSAYSALAGIPYVGPYLGAAAAAAAIAAGMANVNAIKAQGKGYAEGGYTGDIPANKVAGEVHGREFVMTAATTSRIGKENLEKLQSGAARIETTKKIVELNRNVGGSTNNITNMPDNRQTIKNANNIRNIKTANYMRGGYTGNAATNQIAGSVHGREFVMNAGATSRIGASNLEALQRGAATLQTRETKGSTGEVKVNIENYGTSKDFEVEQISRDEIRVIARDEASRQVAKDTPNLVSAEIGNPNSKISKSLSKSTNAGRRR